MQLTGRDVAIQGIIGVYIILWLAVLMIFSGVA